MLPSSLQILKMEEAGIEQAVLFPTSIHMEQAETLEEMEKELHSLNHVLSGGGGIKSEIQRMEQSLSELSAAVSQNPDRFYGFGCVPLGLSADETALWIETRIIKKKFLGLGEFTPGTEANMLQLRQIFSVISEYPGIPIWIHTFSPVTKAGLQILMEFCIQFPKVPVIFGHMGGIRWMETLSFAKKHKNVYLDLSAPYTSLSLRAALKELPERCFYGSDAPFGEPLFLRQMIEYFAAPETAKQVLGENIKALLNI